MKEVDFMEKVIHKEYILEGICCGNCAAKIEKSIKALHGIVSADLDFITQTLCISFKIDADTTSIMGQIREIIKCNDANVVIREKMQLAEGKKEIYLQGLCCTVCAGKIESRIKKLNGVKYVSVDTISQKMTIETDNEHQLPGILRQASEIIQEVEPDIQISYTTDPLKNDNKKCCQKVFLKKSFLAAGTILYVINMSLQFTQAVSFSVFLISYLLIGGEVILRALRNISKGHIFDENFLMAIATIGAFAIGEYPEGVAVMLFYQIGEGFQRLAVSRSKKNIASLMNLRPDFVNLKINNSIQKVSPEEVAVGDSILVKPGERIPMDGRITNGISSLDLSALTGESLPRDVKSGDEVMSGAINKSGLLTVEVSKEFGESTVSKILSLVENASSKKAPTENFITTFARYYTPVVTVAAVVLAIIPPLIWAGESFNIWLYRALAFLVVSCPCALVISVPLTFFGGIGGASRNGVLVKGSNYLEGLNHIDTIIMDKTGTVTKGVFSVHSIIAQNGFSEQDILYYASCAEKYSNHPIAESIIRAFGKTIDTAQIVAHEDIAGYGVKASIDGKTVYLGNSKLMKMYAIPYRPVYDVTGITIYLAVDKKFAGSILIKDEIKPDSRKTIQGLKTLGVRKTVMLTGDTKASGEAIAKEIGMDAVYTELLPQQKVEIFEVLEKERQGNGKIVFVGDGVNDAPVLARADIGIAMGAMGSDAAIEAADIVLMTDEPFKIVSAIRIAKRTQAIVWQNIIFAVVIKIVLLIFAAVGMATMWEAVFGDVGVTVLAVLNAMRAVRTGSMMEMQ
ncbi:Cd2+/Zn2+-exporting ATPase [Megasphaera cerevisiae DSM 20462]|jgi:Cd2+/Zn2+-exporting ATPase|nr:Cd2+/Zn2+-exporting ATPase [Megasphaera cerevisiae DSM 20462]